MSSNPDNDRAGWERLWRDTLWESAADGQWSPLARTSPTPLVVVTAWNPGGRRLPRAVNDARDAVLLAELRTRGWTPLRARGRSADHGWCEEGWQIPHLPSHTRMLLRRYGQLAGWVTDAPGDRYHWCEDWGGVHPAR